MSFFWKHSTLFLYSLTLSKRSFLVILDQRDLLVSEKAWKFGILAWRLLYVAMVSFGNKTTNGFTYFGPFQLPIHLHDFFRQYLDNISEPSGTNTSLNTSPVVIVRRNSPANMLPTSANFSPKIDTPKVVHYANLQHFSQKRGVSAEPARSRMSFPPSK